MADSRTTYRLHSEIEAKVAEFLKARGYPEDSIVIEPRVESKSGNRTLRPDFLILDPKREERLAIIEVKTGHWEKNRSIIQDRLLGMATALSEPGTETFLASPDESGGGLLFYRLNEDGELEEFSGAEFPRFQALVAHKLSAGKESVEQRQEEAADDFKERCSLIAGVAFVIVASDFILDIKDIEVLNPERLAVLGVIAVLLVVPYAAKLKVLGLEWERYNTRNKSDA